MNKGVIRRRGFGRGKKKEYYLRFNGNNAIYLDDVAHNSRMSYEYKIRYNSFGAYVLVCGYFRSMNIQSATSLNSVDNPQLTYTPAESFELNVPYVMSFKCASNGNYTASIDDAIIKTGNNTSYSRGTGMRIGEYDTTTGFARLKADIAYVKIWNSSGVLIKDLVPKEVNGVCGFYDNVSEAFYGPRFGSFTIVE